MSRRRCPYCGRKIVKADQKTCWLHLDLPILDPSYPAPPCQ